VAAPCAECGFAADSISPADAPAAIRSFARRYRAPLTRFLPGEDGDALLRERPDASTWSALEYACHVRDVIDVYDGRVRRALVEDTPTFEPMGRDERAVRERYNEQDPLTVADDLATNAERLAATIESLGAEAWERTAVNQYPEPAPRTVLWMVRNVVHEASHHLLDIGRGLRVVRERTRDRG
jgi:S-DNA-T family DNA segregation ATPase FtsK/SpoIIIE